VVAVQQTESESVTHELNAYEYVPHSQAEVAGTRRAFIALLNRLALEGWLTPSHYTYSSSSEWPQGDFLLVRER